MSIGESVQKGASENKESLLSIIHGRPLSDEEGQGAHTIAGYLKEVTDRFAEREAVVFHTDKGVMRWSYAELWQHAMEVARALIASGVNKDSRVGILMTNRPEYLAAVFGTALAGGAVVALNTFSTPTELEHLLKVSCVTTLLFERHVIKKDFAKVLCELEPEIAKADGVVSSTRFPFLQRLVSIDTTNADELPGIEPWPAFLRRGDGVSDDVIDAREASVTPADLGVVFFSSGTTGMPKGIMHSQRAVAIQWWRWPIFFGMKDDVRDWTANGLFWSGNFALLGTALSIGGTLVLQRYFDAAEALELMQKERINAPHAHPHQWARIEDVPGFAEADLSHVSYVDECLARSNMHPSITQDHVMPNAFGTTETLTIVSSCLEAKPEDRREKGFGLPLPGNILKIIDPLTGEVVPRGERGELLIKGPTLMMAYLGKTDEECFDAEGFYRTGDGGYFDESGWLFWEGRLSNIIKTGGANVSPVEIDNTIEKLPGIKLVQTIGVPHETLGEMVVTCIVLQDGVKLNESAIVNYVKERLASYKVPRKVFIFEDDEIALTGGSAKVKVGQLRELVDARLAAG